MAQPLAGAPHARPGTANRFYSPRLLPLLCGSTRWGPPGFYRMLSGGQVSRCLEFKCKVCKASGLSGAWGSCGFQDMRAHCALKVWSTHYFYLVSSCAIGKHSSIDDQIRCMYAHTHVHIHTHTVSAHAICLGACCCQSFLMHS